MTEPTYEFVPGKGWCIQTCETLTFTNGNGTVTFERRQPNPGEHFFYWNTQTSLKELKNVIGTVIDEHSGGVQDDFPLNRPAVVVKFSPRET